MKTQLNYNELKQEWLSIVERIQRINEDPESAGIEIDEPATLNEIAQVETKLGFPLPETFKQALIHFSKYVNIYWFLPDELWVPAGLEDIGSGHFGWDIEVVRDLSLLGEEIGDDSLLGKLSFFSTPNGDHIVFDMTVSGEPPILYWSHDGEEETIFMANDFNDYLIKMTKLKLVGSEFWEWEAFVEDGKLNVNHPLAKEWRNWFDKL